jgi:GTP cyclohydrolase I
MLEEQIAPATLPRYDLERIEAAVREILLAIGEDPTREGIKDTPWRVAKMYSEVFAGLRQDPSEVLTTTFSEEYGDIVLVKGIQFYSVCEHHLLPIFGQAHVGYVPGSSGKVVGISKLARLVEIYAARPQIQERITRQIAQTLHSELGANAVMVLLEANHMCMAMRGVKKSAMTTTTYTLGQFRQDESLQRQFYRMLQNNAT